MNKKKIPVFLLLIALLVTGLFVVSNSLGLPTKKDKGFYEISVICRGRNMDGCSSIKAGIDQAADDLNAQVNYVTLSSDNDAAQQVSMLKREVGSGVNAIIILPANSNVVVQPIREAAAKVPVIVLQPSIQGLSNMKTVTCNEFQLGNALARKIIKDESPARNTNFIVLKSSRYSKSDLLLSQGITDALKNVNAKISYSDLPEDSKSAYKTARNILMQNKMEAVIALDDSSLEAAGKAKKDLLKSGAKVFMQVYGVGRTDTIISLLEDKVIRAIGVENEYSIGYLGLKMSIDSIEKKEIQNVNVNFVISDSTDMYEPQNEYLLFPFVN